MKSTDKEDVVVDLDLVVQFAAQLPVCVVDQN